MTMRHALLLSMLLAFYGHQSLAQSHFELNIPQILKVLQTAKADTNRTNIYKELTDRYKLINPDSAYYFATQGLTFARSIGDKKGQSKLLNAVGELDLDKGMYNKAQQEYKEALSIDKQTGNIYGQGAAYTHLGVVLLNKGDHTNAANNYLEALKIFEQINNAKGIGAVYMALGMMSEELNEDSKALEYLHRAQNAVQALPFSVMNVQLMNNMGLLYNKMKLYDTALFMFNKGLAKSTAPEYVTVRIQLLSNKSMVLSETGHTKESIENIDESLALARKMHLRMQESYGLVNRASLMKDQPTLAIAQMKEALAISREIGEKHLEAGIYGVLADCYEEHGQFKEALDATKKKNRIQDSLQSAKKNIAIADLESSYSLQIADSKVTSLTAINGRNTFRTRLIITGTVGIAIVLAIVGFYYRKTTLLNKQLVTQGDELKQLNTIATTQREELKGLNTEKDKIFSILGHDLRSPLSNITAALGLLERENSSEENSRYISKLRGQTLVTLDTLDKLLYWGKNSFKGITIQQQFFNANPIIQSNTDLLFTVTQQKGITITNSLPSDIKLFADPSHFDFVVRNLLSNAVKFSHAGGIINLTTAASNKEGFLVFAISDSGTGISDEEQAQLFTIDNAGKAGTQDELGTGIGLLLCKEFLEKNGGDIRVVGQKGIGSTFYFSLRGTT